MSRQTLTLAEQETVINWDNETNTASVYTHDARLINKLYLLADRYPDLFIPIRCGPQKAVTFQIPKRTISIRAPYSEERRLKQKKDAKEKGIKNYLNGGSDSQNTDGL